MGHCRTLTDGRRARQMLEQVAQVLEGLDSVGARSHYQGEQIGTGLGADFVITEHPQLATEGILLNLPLDEIVVDR